MCEGLIYVYTGHDVAQAVPVEEEKLTTVKKV